jgi:hypothetical protein
MIQSKYILLLATLIFMALPMFTLAQSYDDAPIKEGTFSKKNWKQTIKDLEYSENASSKKKRREEELKEEGRRGAEKQEYKPNWAERAMFQGNNTIKIIFFGIAILALVFVIWKIVQAQMKLKNPKVRKKMEFIDDVVEDIHETDLDRFLREALASDNYKMAIRIYYLMIIKELADKKLIAWKKDKTNNIYVREMRTTEYYQNFREITRNFERAWFGEKEVEQADFQKLQPQFQGFVSSIK